METFALGVVFVLGAIISIAFGHAFHQSLGTRYWRRVTGRIRESWISTITGGEDGTQYEANVRYSYEYEGQRYEGDKIAVVGTSSQYRRDAEAITQKYSQDSQVDVYVDPADPRSALLENGICWRALAAALGGAVFMLVAIVIGHL